MVLKYKCKPLNFILRFLKCNCISLKLKCKHCSNFSIHLTVYGFCNTSKQFSKCKDLILWIYLEFFIKMPLKMMVNVYDHFLQNPPDFYLTCFSSRNLQHLGIHPHWGLPVLAVTLCGVILNERNVMQIKIIIAFNC